MKNIVAILIAGLCMSAWTAKEASSAPSQRRISIDGRFNLSQFGADSDGNGVPDRLDSYVKRLDKSPEVKAAAIDYYRVATYLSAKALSDERLTEDEKQSVFDGVMCIQLLDESGKVLLPESEFMSTREGFNGMNALEDQLSGTAYELGNLSKADCLALHWGK